MARLLMRPSLVPMFAWRRQILVAAGAKLERGVKIYPSAKVWAPWNLEAETVAAIGPDVEVYNPALIRIGHHAVVSQGAYLCTASHDYNDAAFPLFSKPIQLGAYSWICARAVVLPGVTVGEGAVLGACGVATRDLEAWTVYGGNPARPIRRRQRTVA